MNWRRRMTFVCVLLLFTVVFASCKQEAKQSQLMVPPEYTSTSTPQATLSADFDRLISGEIPSLMIQKLDESAIPASPDTAETIFNMLQTAYADDFNGAYNRNSDFASMETYDYKLQFSGYKDILYTVKGGIFHFEGEMQLYLVNAYMGEYKFEQLSHMSGEYRLNEQAIYELEDDFDGNGMKEQAKLIYNGDLILEVAGQRQIAFKDFWYREDANMPYTTFLQMPEIKSLTAESGHVKPILVSVIWATNKIGSIAGLRVYDYRNGNLTKVWENAMGEAGTSELIDGNKLTVSLPSFDLKQTVEVSDNMLSSSVFHNNSDAGEVFVPNPEVYAADITEYWVLSEDGHDYLMTEQIICVYSCPWSIGRMLAFYEIKDGSIVHTKAYIPEGHQRNILEAMLNTDNMEATANQIKQSIGEVDYAKQIDTILAQMVKDHLLQLTNGNYRIVTK